MTNIVKTSLFFLIFICLFGCTENTIHKYFPVNEEDQLIDDMVRNYIEPIDTLEVIEENYWISEAIEDKNSPLFIHPSGRDLVVFRTTYNDYKLTYDSLELLAYQNGKHKRKTFKIVAVNTKKLTIRIADKDISFTNDQAFLNKHKIKTISYSLTDAEKARHSMNIELDSTQYKMKISQNRYRVTEKYYRRKAPEGLLDLMNEKLSHIDFNKAVYDYSKGRPPFLLDDKFELIIEYENGEKIHLNSAKKVLNPRFSELIDLLENTNKFETIKGYNGPFSKLLGLHFSEPDRVEKVSFLTKEVKIKPLFPEPIEEENVEEVEIEEITLPTNDVDDIIDQK